MFGPLFTSLVVRREILLLNNWIWCKVIFALGILFLSAGLQVPIQRKTLLGCCKSAGGAMRGVLVLWELLFAILPSEGSR